jgi:hypothetical protein
MALSFSITLTIMISHVFFFQKKKLSFLLNSIVFMILAIITRNYMTIMTMELKLLKTTEDHVLFLFFLVNREIIIPLLILIFTNIYLQTTSLKKKIFLFIGVLLFMHGMDYLSVHLKVITFIKWNFIYAAIVNVVYLLIGLGLAKIVLFLQKWESTKNDSSI